jgi:hypothetical protein
MAMSVRPTGVASDGKRHPGWRAGLKIGTCYLTGLDHCDIFCRIPLTRRQHGRGGEGIGRLGHLKEKSPNGSS